jgi:hypothetical protein
VTGERWAGVITEHCTEDPHAPAAARPAEGVLDRSQIEEAKHLSLVDGALHRAPVGHVAEVDERAGRAGAGDAIVAGLIGGGERDAGMDLDSGPGADASAGEGDVGLDLGALMDAPQHGMPHSTAADRWESRALRP